MTIIINSSDYFRVIVLVNKRNLKFGIMLKELWTSMVYYDMLKEIDV